MQRMRERQSLALVVLGLPLIAVPDLSLLDMFTNQQGPHVVELVASLLFSFSERPSRRIRVPYRSRLSRG